MSRAVWRRVERTTSDGRRYAYYEPVMPRIPDQLLNSVVYLFQDEGHAREGRGSGGTGFLIDFPSEASGDRRWYVVTNVPSLSTAVPRCG